MLLTEEEAKEKYCCQGLDGISEVMNANNDISHIGGKCIASGCMAWRWKCGGIIEKNHKSDCEGYCGLAGKPE